MNNSAQKKLISLDKFQKQFQQNLKKAGYDSPEKIINLVQEIKQKIATEHKSKKVAEDKYSCQ
ncbi:hypothetical protein Xen7305DRAFT_00044810 [Xenococcus sp. PCC 7305]|uniref:hypothetical protein n=1 Tax=Xenococcus sp. PCC 7305 TaxID=102125 RepID=UPI0002ACF428|nr:hypothetical protein [Xenococcus sp. PCC 7305]ELS04745.1 hypothetical protein Xen7305DRAFT_00044810 [Xenococcus sp. PCC 7305]